MTISLLILAPVPLIGAACYQLGCRSDGDDGGDEKVRLDGAGVPPPSITGITTTTDRAVTP